MKISLTSRAAVVAVYSVVITCQLQPFHPQTDTWNSTFSLTRQQIKTYNLSDTLVNNIEVAKRFEETAWATGSVLSDPFYTNLPPGSQQKPAGTVLKVEPLDVKKYTIPPTLALSRIIYQSKSFDGKLVPVSAYILWPFRNRNGDKVAPLVSWGHGTSGIFAECAPSHVRNLWYHFAAPFQLALNGYAVVATDYAGLGVAKYANGKPISVPYIVNSAAGNDLLYAAKAAHAAFPGNVSREFVVMGHSQGGGAAWGAAEQQVKEKVPGYLGTVSAAPVTNALEQAKIQGPVATSIGLFQIANSIKAVFPNVKLEEILTKGGVDILNLLGEIQGCSSVTTAIVQGILTENPQLLGRLEFTESKIGRQWTDIASAGGKPLKGPMLVMQGTEDATIPGELTAQVAAQTCEISKRTSIEYLQVHGAGHMAVLYAGMPIWLSWIDNRFADSSSGKTKRENSRHRYGTTHCSNQTIGTNTPQPVDQYNLQDIKYFFQYANSPYQIA